MKCPKCGKECSYFASMTIEEVWNQIKLKMTTGKINPPKSEDYCCMECGWNLKN